MRLMAQNYAILFRRMTINCDFFIKHTYEMGSYDAARDLLYEMAEESEIEIW
jgi:hypothetical protein